MDCICNLQLNWIYLVEGFRVDIVRIVELIFGDKFYQVWVCEVLFILVCQVEVYSLIYYFDFVKEVGILNFWNFNYVLGSIGMIFENFFVVWFVKVFFIQCFVINKNMGLSGEGVGWFVIKEEDFFFFSRKQ